MAEVIENGVQNCWHLLDTTRVRDEADAPKSLPYRGKQDGSTLAHTFDIG